MSVLKLYSHELTHTDLLAISYLIANAYDLVVFPLPLARDELLGNQVEAIFAKQKKPLGG